MASSSKKEKKMVAVIGIGATRVSFDIILFLLTKGATVIVPAQSSTHLLHLQDFLKGYNTDKLVTLLTDLPDYEKATSLTETILEAYGPLDLAVFPFDFMAISAGLPAISIAQWQRGVEENLSVYFICCRVIIDAMKKRDAGTMIALVDNIHMAQHSHDTMSEILVNGQQKMAGSFFEEVKGTGIRFHHLFINNTAANESRKQIGAFIYSIYKHRKVTHAGPFLFFENKVYPHIEQ